MLHLSCVARCCPDLLETGDCPVCCSQRCACKGGPLVCAVSARKAKDSTPRTPPKTPKAAPKSPKKATASTRKPMAAPNTPKSPETPKNAPRPSSRKAPAVRRLLTPATVLSAPAVFDSPRSRRRSSFSEQLNSLLQDPATRAMLSPDKENVGISACVDLDGPVLLKFLEDPANAAEVSAAPRSPLGARN
jgi:hypothetical protein